MWKHIQEPTNRPHLMGWRFRATSTAEPPSTRCSAQPESPWRPSPFRQTSSPPLSLITALPYFDRLPEDALRAHLSGNEDRDLVPDDGYRLAAVTSKLSGSGKTISYQVDLGNYRLYQAHIRDLILSRMLEREGSGNYRLGSGSVSSGGSGEGGSAAPLPGVIPVMVTCYPIWSPTSIFPKTSAISTPTNSTTSTTSGAGQGDMLYQNASGLWVVVGGTKGDGKTPMWQVDGSIGWETPSGGGGGGGLTLTRGINPLMWHQTRSQASPTPFQRLLLIGHLRSGR